MSGFYGFLIFLNNFIHIKNFDCFILFYLFCDYRISALLFTLLAQKYTLFYTLSSSNRFTLKLFDLFWFLFLTLNLY